MTTAAVEPDQVQVANRATRHAPDDSYPPGHPLRTIEDLVAQLLTQLDALADPTGRHRARVGEEGVLEAFLAAAGVHQTLEDYLSRDVLIADRAARLAARSPRFAPAPAPALAGACRALGAAGFRARQCLPRHRRWAHVSTACAELSAALAQQLMRPSTSIGSFVDADIQRFATALRDLARSDLRGELVGGPACFAAFDQQLEDLSGLAEQTADWCAAQGAPVLVLGLRTSGSYMAPLLAAALRQLIDQPVGWMTIRPSLRLLAGDQRRIARVAAVRGAVVIVDDPPRTGAQVTQVAGRLEAAGVSADRIRPALALAPDSMPVEARLARWRPALLRSDDWAIRRRLRGAELERTLSTLLEGQAVRASGSLETVAAVRDARAVRVEYAPRAHASAMLEVTLDTERGSEARLRVVAEGVGVGWFARQAPAAIRRLPEFSPAVFGVRGGLLFRESVEDFAPVTEETIRQRGDEFVAALATYLTARNERLALRHDPSLDSSSADTVWMELAELLARTFPSGVANLLARPLARATVHRVVHDRRSGLIDGRMRLDEWFVTEDGPRPTFVKRRPWGGMYSDKRLYCGDPTLDVACAAAELERLGQPRLGVELRAQVERSTGKQIDEHTWLLYRLLDHALCYEDCLRTAAASDREPEAFERTLALERVMARCYRAYVERRYLADLSAPDDGPLCAIDIDGVLEDRWLHFPAAPPAGVLALRMLSRHGQRAVLATGRSLSEVRERCASYRLAGGVAEYGGVIYDHRDGACVSLLSDDDRRHLKTLRESLAGRARVYLDPEHEHSVRVHSIDARGVRRALADELVESALGLVPSGSVRAVRGALQTDFVPAGIDKGIGLRALSARLDVAHAEGRPIALAVGDSDADLPMFGVAQLAFVPANATAAAATLATRLRLDGAAALGSAVEKYLGHAPGVCAGCRPRPVDDTNAPLLADWLSALSRGRRTKAAALASIAARLLLGSSIRRGDREES